MRGSVSAELLLLRRRRSTWILLALWTALATFFSYLLPYLEYRNGDLGGGPGEGSAAGSSSAAHGGRSGFPTSRWTRSTSRPSTRGGSGHS